MFRLYEHIERALARWASRKYKSLSRRKQASMLWLRKMKNADPGLFHHWRVVGIKVG